MVHWAVVQETDRRLLLSGIFLRWWVVYINCPFCNDYSKSDFIFVPLIPISANIGLRHSGASGSKRVRGRDLWVTAYRAGVVWRWVLWVAVFCL